MWLKIAVWAVVAVPVVAGAQGTPGTNVVVTVGITAVSMRGDTTGITYVLRNDPSSGERVFRFTVDAPASVLRISPSDLQAGWYASIKYRAQSVARWAALGHQMLPGEQSPPLAFEAVGLPAIVTSWVQGYFPAPTDIPSDTLAPSDPLLESSVAVRTVGVEPFPSDRSSANLLVRLLGLADRSCTLGWITSATVCTWLRGKLDAATQAIRQGNWARARSELQGCLSELEKEHRPGLPVNDSAYWLVKVNAEYILTRL